MNRRAFFLGAAMVLLGSFVAIALRAYAEAAFLGAYGAKRLPWLLIANAGGFAFATLGYDFVSRRARAGAIDLVLLIALIGAAAAAPSLLRSGVTPIVLVIALAAGSQVAGLALWNRVCAAVAGRDARRFLPRAGAGVTAGGAIAGLGAGVLIPRLGLSAIPLIGAAVTAVVAAICVAQERALAKGGAPGGVPGGPGMPAVTSAGPVIAGIADVVAAKADAAKAALASAKAADPMSASASVSGTKAADAMSASASTSGAKPAASGLLAAGGLTPVQRRLITAMFIVAGIEGVVATVIDLQFISAVKARWSGEDLAVALALFYGGTNLFLLLLQVAAVPHLLVTRSLPFTAAIHPVIVILSYAGFAASPGFVGIAGTRTVDQVLRFATSRTSQEVSLSALPPGPRARWKVLLRGAVWPAGAAVAALVLLLVGPPALRDPTRLAVIAIGVAIAWAIAARVAARRFQTALAAPLGIRETRVDDPRRIDLETLERWAQAAGADDAKQAALARAALVRARIDATDLADHLRHDEPAVRAALFDQLARSPTPALRGELKAAIGIEDDDRALVLGIKALAIAGDDAGIVRGEARAGLARDVDDAVASAKAMLRGGTTTSDATESDTTARDQLGDELLKLLARDPAWAVAMVRARPGIFVDDFLDTKLREALANPATRAGAYAIIARVGPDTTRPLLAAALEDGDAAALAAIEDIDLQGAASLAPSITSFSPLARATLARTLAAAPTTASELVAHLIVDGDPEVAYAALRTALAITRGGGTLPTIAVEAAYDNALAAFTAHLNARDAVAAIAKPADVTWTACARTELEIATRRCAARVLWAAAVEAANAGRDPAPIAASARHLIGSREADRKRALDVVQELQARPQLLALIERWLQPPKPSHDESALTALGTFDPWLAALGAGETRALEPMLVDLRRPALFSSIAGPALAALAERTTRIRVTGELFREGELGDTMYIVAAGALIAKRASAPTSISGERRIGVGEVVGELAVLTHAPRAATLSAATDDKHTAAVTDDKHTAAVTDDKHTAAVTDDKRVAGTEVVAIDRAAFAAASRRAPELVLGLSSTLAGWLAPNRPDVL
ncbi:MAG TPA: hypothetical protein VMZ53_29420 [Kofleriaceae bacterium]|nr:hypothetical protein [Kofleriaceae bacterium]